ncbi:MAG: hypothetical protein AABW68_04765 [archaeon]
MGSSSWVVGGLLFLFLAGCVSPPPLPSSNSGDVLLEDDVLPFVPDPILPSPGSVVVFCDEDTSDENAECFEEAFESCARAVGVFWETSDGYSLQFESQGLDTLTGACLVRVSVADDSSQFFGQSAQCSIEQSPAGMGHESPFFDSYLIGPSTCTGAYVDSIVKDAPSTPPNPPVVAASTPNVKEFSIVVNEDGVVGTSTFDVMKGDLVTLMITVDTSDVSFNGEEVYGPAQKGLPVDQYIFYAGHILPGQSKTVEFVAQESFDFGVYWPGSSVLKGKGQFVVSGN